MDSGGGDVDGAAFQHPSSLEENDTWPRTPAAAAAVVALLAKDWSSTHGTPTAASLLPPRRHGGSMVVVTAGGPAFWGKILNLGSKN
ncbi:unnamed protein product [Sphagnum balticum]